MDDKRRICEMLLPLLQETSRLYNLKNLEYDQETEMVTATLNNGETRQIHVWMHSGLLVIEEIIKELGA